jgi:hypothetical protein
MTESLLNNCIISAGIQRGSKGSNPTTGQQPTGFQDNKEAEPDLVISINQNLKECTKTK